MNKLAQRIQSRLDAMGMTARRASLQAGLSPGAVGKMLSGDSESPRAKNLQSLATVLHCDPAYLTGERDDPGHLTGPVEGWPVIRIGGEARFGAWGEGDQPLTGSGVLFMPPMPEYEPIQQSAMILADRHMERLFQPQTVLHLLSFKQGSLREGDVVVISRSRFEGRMFEITARQVESVAFRAKLTTRFNNADIDDALYYTPSAEDVSCGTDENGEKVYIFGRALRAYLGLGAPPLYELDDERRRLEILAMTKNLRIPS